MTLGEFRPDEVEGILEAVRDRLERAKTAERRREGSRGETSWWGRLLEKIERMARP